MAVRTFLKDFKRTLKYDIPIAYITLNKCY